jgi:hypothetical protein
MLAGVVWHMRKHLGGSALLHCLYIRFSGAKKYQGPI